MYSPIIQKMKAAAGDNEGVDHGVNIMANVAEWRCNPFIIRIDAAEVVGLVPLPGLTQNKIEKQ